MQLKNGNLEIRRFESNDLEYLWQIAFINPDAEWTKFNGPYFEDKMPAHERFVSEIGPKWLTSDNMQAIIVDRKLVGLVSAFYEDDDIEQWREVGIVIYDERQWGQHIGTRALKLWLDYQFSITNLPHIGFTTWSGNERMMKLGDRVGMQLEGRIRKVRYWNSKYWDSIKYGILREEWQLKK